MLIRFNQSPNRPGILCLSKVCTVIKKDGNVAALLRLLIRFTNSFLSALVMEPQVRSLGSIDSGAVAWVVSKLSNPTFLKGL
jgi:hypothetical protein